MYVYKIIRLIFFAIIITYFVGCSWYFVSNELNPAGTVDTFVKNNGLVGDDVSDYRRVIVSCYFALTTLSTVGYGDYYPISNGERIYSILIMLAGVAFFSYIMGSFIAIISNYD